MEDMTTLTSKGLNLTPPELMKSGLD